MYFLALVLGVFALIALCGGCASTLERDGKTIAVYCVGACLMIDADAVFSSKKDGLRIGVGRPILSSSPPSAPEGVTVE